MIAAALVALAAVAPVDTAPVAIIPAPSHLERRDGAFVVDAGLHVVLADLGGEEAHRLREMADSILRNSLGRPLGSGGSAKDALILDLDRGAEGLGTEGYRLEVSPDGIRITAAAGAGLFYGLQTLRQLFPPPGSEPGGWAIPALAIEDVPRFPWRGLHLDVGRHFFPPEFIKRYIDLMAQWKLNTFHWHLTEDQGWRLQIRKYPRLTSVGSRRRETVLGRNLNPYVGDSTPYGGFYTQDQVREIVDYAADRYVTIVPEIEMPGHSLAALAAYPRLACTPGPFEVGTTWGVFEDIYCPSEATFTFLENVLTEVMELFPSTFIHIGGDEAPKARWKRSPLAQRIIRREGLKDEHELQSWFIHRIDRFLTAHGRRLVGWDEILEGGLAPGATVMSWRGVAGGIAAAREGHDVVMTPTSHLYFDYYQSTPDSEPLANGGVLPLEKTYGFEPVPDSLTAEEAGHVLGAQGNVWTEYIPTPAQAEYMAWPRALALAEVVWSPKERRDWNDFRSRLPVSLRLLEAQGVNYRRRVTGD